MENWRPSMPFTSPSSKEMCMDVIQQAAVPRGCVGVVGRRQSLSMRSAHSGTESTFPVKPSGWIS